MRILAYIVLGLGIGTLSGMLGIGGGVLLVPALMWLCGWDYPRAAGTTLAVLVPPVGLLAAWRAYLDDRVDLEAAGWVAVTFAVGAYVGAAAVDYIPRERLQFAFGLLMLYVAVRFLVGSNSETASAAAGLTAAGLAWLAYLGLRAVGRRYRARPDLGRHIETSRQQVQGDVDYYI